MQASSAPSRSAAAVTGDQGDRRNLADAIGKIRSRPPRSILKIGPKKICSQTVLDLPASQVLDVAALEAWPTAIRLSSDLRSAVDDWASKQEDAPGRSAANRRLVEIGLKAKK